MHGGTATRSQAVRILLLACAAGTVVPPAHAQDSAPAASLHLSIDAPEDGAIVGDPGGMAFISGRALAHRGSLQTFDIIFVIDRSQSTVMPTGGDVNGDGVNSSWTCGHVPIVSMLGTLSGACSRPQDSVFDAEIAAARSLLEQLDPRATQVGVVAFSGDADPSTKDAETIVSLTTDYARIRAALEELRSAGPEGRTNMQAGVQEATLGLARAPRMADAEGVPARKIMLFMSDGQPTLPFEESPHNCARLAIAAAVRAGKLGIRIDSYGIGKEALEKPTVLMEMARLTEGTFTPVEKPSLLQSVFERANFSEIEQLRITNRTNQSAAGYQLLNADGTFSALIPVVTGRNTIEVEARASDGSRGTRQLSVEFLADAQVQRLSPRQVEERNRLLQNHLADLRERSLQLETEHADGARRQLEIQMEEARARRLRIEQEESPEAAPDRPSPDAAP